MFIPSQTCKALYANIFIGGTVGIFNVLDSMGHEREERDVYDARIYTEGSAYLTEQ
jgi:hypothetical protein